MTPTAEGSDSFISEAYKQTRTRTWPHKRSSVRRHPHRRHRCEKLGEQHTNVRPLSSSNLQTADNRTCKKSTPSLQQQETRHSLAAVTEYSTTPGTEPPECRAYSDPKATHPNQTTSALTMTTRYFASSTTRRSSFLTTLALPARTAD